MIHYNIYKICYELPFPDNTSDEIPIVYDFLFYDIFILKHNQR